VIGRGATLAGRALVLGWMVMLTVTGTAQAQVGISSGLAQVVLVARSEPRASIDSVGTPIERGISGSTRELSVAVRVTTNTGYRLSVIRNDPRDSDWGGIWVKTESGEFRNLDRGSTVLVARGENEPRPGGLDVLYRVERVTQPGAVEAPPVRYEIAINPQL
jgi:hypothetical protein